MTQLAFTAPVATVLPVAGTDSGFPVRRVYCVGRNYAEHAKEMGFTGREPPFFFMKPADSLLHVSPGQSGEMAYPPGTSDLHHEIELVVAIGAGGSDIAVASARTHVFGYAVGLDMTRRDLQGEAKKAGRPWEIGKAFDQSAPIGAIVPTTQVENIDQAAITLSVNGTIRQQSSIAELIWNIDEIIAHLSTYWALAPGDLIFTGTPAGVAAVKRGDLMHGTIAGIGELSVTVV